MKRLRVEEIRAWAEEYGERDRLDLLALIDAQAEALKVAREELVKIDACIEDYLLPRHPTVVGTRHRIREALSRLNELEGR